MRRLSVLLALTLVLPLAGALTTAGADEHDCPALDALKVPGAEFVQAVCLEDLTTLSNSRTDTGPTSGAGRRDSGSMHSSATEHSDTPVPGVQIEGWFPDSCDNQLPENNITFVPPCENGLRANSQFVIRIPNDWDGETLLVAGTPGIRTQFSSDIILSDRVLTRGWAYASQDKGNTGVTFYRAGDTETGGSPNEWIPAKAIQQWSEMMGKAAVGARGALESLHGRLPTRTYAAGISNGGYQTRLALEQHPELFDGGVDWEGTLFRAEGPNLFTYLPPILRNYHAARVGSEAAFNAMVHEGRLPPWSEPIWDNHYSIYWGLTQRVYRQEFDPEYTNYLDLPPALTPGDPDAEYDYFARPEVVRERVASVSNSGDINGKPLITLHGDLDALLPIDTDSDVYADLVRGNDHGDAFRYWVVEGGTHVDTAADANPDVMRPILPCFIEALDDLDAWVRVGAEPPPSGLIPFPADTTHQERANSCSPPSSIERVAGATRIETSLAAARRGFHITETVVMATAGDFPDALTAAPLAAGLGGPILLVGDALTDGHRTELERMGTLNVVVVGGSAAVSDDVVAEVEELGVNVRRVAGPDRYATAAEIAREVDVPDGHVFVATGERFPDALSGAPLAAALGAPILLTQTDALPPVTATALEELSVERTTVLGGSNAVAQRVVGALPSPSRVAGADRYATSVAVADRAVAEGLQIEHLHVATGRTFPDALSAGPMAFVGQRGAPGLGIVLLVDGHSRDSAGASWGWLERNAGEVRQTLIFGGSAAITPAVEDSLRAVR